jgi:hypothetical protein
VLAGRRRGGGRVDAEQAAAVPLPEQQREQRLGETGGLGPTLGPDVLGESRDVSCVTLGVQDPGQFGEPDRLGDDQAVQADELIRVHPEHDAGGQRLERAPVTGGIQGDSDGQIFHHRREQRVLIAEI